MKVVTILGTRPEIIKLSPLIPLLDKEFTHILVHTGQHYSYNMDKIFFDELELRDPDYTLNVGSDTHARQVAKMMVEIEDILLEEKPNVVLVYADPNTPLAGALAAAKLNIPVVHLEAGCRSFNKKMPEEVNRILIDHCADFFPVPDKKAEENLLREGIDTKRITIVGSTLVDAVLRNKALAEKSTILEKLDLGKDEYVVATIHRAENTTDVKRLQGLIAALNEVSEFISVVFPIHPRTKKFCDEHHIHISEQVKKIEPLGYLDFLKLMSHAKFLLSDSGGIQEESVILNIPLLILREETEWTNLVDIGKNISAGTKKENIVQKCRELVENKEIVEKMKKIPSPLEPGASMNIINFLKKHVTSQ